MLLVVVVIGILLLAALVIITLAAYKIDADSFEFTTAVTRVASISIKIKSRRRRSSRDVAHHSRPCTGDSRSPIVERPKMRPLQSPTRRTRAPLQRTLPP
jgi:hypothetical protein